MAPLLLGFGLAGCAAVGPDFVERQPEMPPQWSTKLDQGLLPADANLSAWWEIFHDPVLNELLNTAQRNNNNLEIAGLRVLESRARLGIASGSLYPQTQLAAGEANWISPPDNAGIGSDFWQYSLSAIVSWEADFWGRFERSIESADAAFLASVAGFEQARVLVSAAVVDIYVLIRTIEEQLSIAQENLQIQQRSYEITEVLYRNGAESELDVQQAKTLLLSTRSTIPALQSALEQSRNALAALLGLPPGSLDDKLAESQGIPALPDQVAIGLPADLLRRRPDVRQAEWLARSQNALVGLAAADLYPSFSLTGSVALTAGGAAGGNFGDLFSSDALSLSIGPSFVWPFLNYGRIKNNIRVQDARLQQALIDWHETVLQAARETEDALAAFTGLRQQTGMLASTVDSAKRSNQIATLRYREGFSDYQRVLDSQQSLFAQQRRYIDVQGETVRSLVALYKALGGGWQADDGGFIQPGTREAMQQRSDWGDLFDALDSEK